MWSVRRRWLCCMAVGVSLGCTSEEQATTDKSSNENSLLSSSFSLACSYMSWVGCKDPIPGSPYSYAGGTPGSKGKWFEGTDKCNNESRFGGYHEYGLVNGPPLSGIDSGSDDLEGIVSGGAPDDAPSFSCTAGGCVYTHLSRTDNPCDHHDRDINIEVVPTTNADRTTRRNAPLSASNLIGHSPGGTRGALLAETEWMQFYPAWPSCRVVGANCSSPGNLATDVAVYPGDDTNGVPLNGGVPTPVLDATTTNSGDTGYLGVPYRGDEIALRGRHVYDCGHSWGEYDSGTGPGYDIYPISNNQVCATNAACASKEGCGVPGCSGTIDNSCATLAVCAGASGPNCCQSYTGCSVSGSFCTGTYQTQCPAVAAAWDASGNNPYCPVDSRCGIAFFGGTECWCAGGLCQMRRSFAAEFHPVQAAVWLHPAPNTTRDGKVWMMAMSHEPYPIGDTAPIGTTRYAFDGSYNGGPPATDGRPMTARFHVPGGPSPSGEKLFVQPVLTDWVLDPQLQAIAWPCDTGSTGCFLGIPDSTAQPWSYFGRAGSCANGPVTAADLKGNAANYFDVARTDNLDGTLTVSLSQIIGMERNNFEVPAIIGAHFRVCYPECSAGARQNSCPQSCKVPPSGVCPSGLVSSGGFCKTAAPASLLVMMTAGQVGLWWSPVSGAGYAVYRSRTSSGPYVKIGSSTSAGSLAPNQTTPGYVDLAADPATTYFYVVKAITQAGYESENSPEGSMLTPPPPPPWITATSSGVGPGSIQVTWGTAPTAIVYVLQRSQPPNEAPLFVTTSSTSYLDTGLTPGVSYSYAVKAGNSSGYGGQGSWTSAIAQPCGAPNCSGCCSGNSCLPEALSTGCVNGGGACGAACGTGAVCASGACFYPCNSTTCPSGCCQNNTCYTGTTTAQCGGGGSACSQCILATSTNTCSNHTCTCVSQPCRAPAKWDPIDCKCVNFSL